MKILFGVHRYYPYPGGSENTTRCMAEAALALGHDVTVWAPINHGDQNGVKVTNNTDVLFEPHDLIIVHGCGPSAQNYIFQNIDNIPSPVLYMIVKPEETPIHLHATQKCRWIAAGTLEDEAFIIKHGVQGKAVYFRYGVIKEEVIGQKTFRDKFDIPKDKKMILSCGGYWPHKAMVELVESFKIANNENLFLVTTGYHNDSRGTPKDSENVKNLFLEDRHDVVNAMADADLYVMNSYEEGFGLVLVESMFNKTPWVSRDIAAAKLFADYGKTYNTQEELVEIFNNLDSYKFDVETAYDYVKNNHTSFNTIDDLLVVLKS